MKRSPTLLKHIFFLSLIPFLFQTASAQFQNQFTPQSETKFGLGLNTVLSISDGFGMGFRGRFAAPMNADFSVAIDLGLTGFVLQGRDDTSLVFDPQISGIVSIPAGVRLETYLLAGIGGFIFVREPSATKDNGPLIHFGLGWVRELQESSLFYEFDPAVIIGRTKVEFILPFRVGIIFG